MRDFERSFLEEIRLIEDITESRLDVERLDIPRLGERSVAYVWGCARECEEGEKAAYVLQFQRANVISVIALTGASQGNPVDELVRLATMQDQHVATALNANN
jgi:hypothetical protein